MDETTDVIVVGAGGSGLAAAVSAAEHGLRVLVLEKRPQPGGTTGLAVGSFTAAGTRWQAAQGIADDTAAHREDIARFAPPALEARNNAELRDLLVAEAPATLRWLAGMGVGFQGPNPEPPNRAPRMHNVVPNAKAYVAALHADLVRRGGELRCGVAVRELLSEDGRVAGVLADGAGGARRLRARRGVVLAAGDYAANAALIARHKGAEFAAMEAINPHATGDGHELAAAAGARLVNMDVTYGPELRFVPPPGRPFAQLLPASGPLARLAALLLPLVPGFVLGAVARRLLVTWQHPEDALFAAGAVLLDRDGRRFCDETRSPAREIALARRPAKEAFILLDERLCRLFSAWPNVVSTAPRIAWAYVADYLRLRPDVARRAGSVAELARAVGMDADTAQAAVAAWNAAAAGAPDAFGRQPPAPLAGSSWVLLGPLRPYITITEGSPAVDRALRVLDQQGQPIPGLYAVGQNGVGGQILWGHGLHIAWAMTSGRLVGAALAAAGSPAPVAPTAAVG